MWRHYVLYLYIAAEKLAEAALVVRSMALSDPTFLIQIWAEAKLVQEVANILIPEQAFWKIPICVMEKAK